MAQDITAFKNPESCAGRSCPFQFSFSLLGDVKGKVSVWCFMVNNSLNLLLSHFDKDKQALDWGLCCAAEASWKLKRFCFRSFFYGYLLSRKSDTFSPIYDNDEVSTRNTF